MNKLREWKRAFEEGMGTPPYPVVAATIAGYGLLGFVFVPRLWRLIPW